MKKLFSVQYGSFLYGTFTPTSDTDWKHIVLPNLDDLLVGKPLKNKAENTNTAQFVKNSENDEDREFIPVQIFAKHFLEGQAYALELCYATEYSAAKQTLHDPLFLGFCRELRGQFLTSTISGIIGYAVNQASLYSFKGERLNTVRATKNMLESFIAISPAGVTPMDCVANFEISAREIAVQFPKYFELTTYSIDANGTQRPCIKLLEKILPYTSTFETMMKTVNSLLKKYGSRANAASIDNVDWKSLAHAGRVVDEGIQLLETQTLTFPFDKEYVDFFLSVKEGKLEHKFVIDRVNTRLELLKELELKSSLPKRTPERVDHLNRWLAEWMRVFYKLS